MIVVHSNPPSRNTRDLADEVMSLVARFRADHPKVTAGEVQAALATAQQRLGSDHDPSTPIRVAIVAAVSMVVAGLVALAASPGARTTVSGAPWVFVSAIIAVVALAIAFVIARSRG
ncbi:MAG: hypothetical protein U0163_08310 [Gemmatimonadaceae bacterium]